MVNVLRWGFLLVGALSVGAAVAAAPLSGVAAGLGGAAVVVGLFLDDGDA